MHLLHSYNINLISIYFCFSLFLVHLKHQTLLNVYFTFLGDLVLQEPCDRNDPYGAHWKTFKSETMEKDCSVGVPGALGKAYWKCSCTNNRCKFDTNQPNVTDCQSLRLVAIADSVKFIC